MALIKCPECGKEISSEAQACVECGHPLTLTFQAAFKKVALEQAVARQQKKMGCGTLFLIGAAAYILILAFNALMGIGSEQTEENTRAAYQAGALAGELEARFAHNSGSSFGYPFNRQTAVALAQQKVSNAGEFAGGPGRQKWIDGFADAFKTFVDSKATELHRIR
jgi:hypothetical protein